MSDTHAALPPPASPIALWPAEVLARHLVSDEAAARTMALGMAVQPGAPLASCVVALTQCAELSSGDALASQLAATAFGCLPPALATEAVQARLVLFLDQSHAPAVRIAAAHALYRLGCLPASGRDPLCSMLLDADPNARKVALLLLEAHAPATAGNVSRLVATTEPAQWTLESLQALTRSASRNPNASANVADFLTRALTGVPVAPVGVAVYAALARLHPQGPGSHALLRIAADIRNADASAAALEALGSLGEAARPAAKVVAQLLEATDDPAREELLCRTMVRLRAAAEDVPVVRALQRLSDGPDRSAAAHCMLLCLHPKEFRRAAVAARQRYAGAGSALQHALAQTYKTLTGNELTGDAVAGKV